MAKEIDWVDALNKSSVEHRRTRSEKFKEPPILKYAVRFAVVISQHLVVRQGKKVRKGGPLTHSDLRAQYTITDMFKSGDLSGEEMKCIAEELLTRSPDRVGTKEAYLVMKVGMRSVPELRGLIPNRLKTGSGTLNTGPSRQQSVSRVFNSLFSGEFQLQSFADHASALIECKQFITYSTTRTKMEPDEDRLGTLEKGLASALKGLRGGDYANQRALLVRISDATRAAIAKAFGPILTERAKAFPQQDYEDKKALARFINSELRRFGLAIKCPKTGMPAFLVAHPGGQPGIGRFHLEVTDSGKPRRTVTSSEFPESLSLMPDQVLLRAGVAEPPRSR